MVGGLFIKRIADEVAAIVALPAVKQRFDEMGTIPVGSTPAEFESFIGSETAKWGKVIRDAKITAE
jgi:tripartite-type tricarboxylate transporter receptor subunit TctC